MTSYTPSLLLSQPTPLDPAVRNIWGQILNTNDGLIDSAVGGLLPLDVSGSSNVILTSIAGAPDQARNAIVIISGVLTGNITVFWPALTGRFVVKNATTGAFSVTLAINNGSGSPAGATVTLAQGRLDSFFSDGTNFSSASGGAPVPNYLSFLVSGTYTPAVGCRQAIITMCGGGGGGGGASAANDAGAGGAGGDTIFNGIHAAAGRGGSAGNTGGNVFGGRGGQGGSGAAYWRGPGSSGNPGISGFNSVNGNVGGNGGNSLMGGGGEVFTGPPPANSGGGGPGTSAGTTDYSGAGGGGGETVKIIINNPAGPYPFTIGAAGLAGAAGSGVAGNAGATGILLVKEIF